MGVEDSVGGLTGPGHNLVTEPLSPPLILALLVWPGIMAWLQAKRSAMTINKVHESMTNPNGGGSVKDALDRIEQRQEDQGLALTGLGERMTAVEDQITRPPC